MMKRKKIAKRKFVSIIIPAFMQEKTIEADLSYIKSVLEVLRYDYEIIVVVDGKNDRTFEKAKTMQSSKLTVLGYLQNRGKGFAIRYGMMRTRGDIIGFIDSGMDLNPNGLSMLLEHFEWYNADIIVGSKRHPASKVNYPISRRIISFFSQILIKVLFGLEVRDTQVGMKFFRRDVIEDILPRLLVKKFAFDIEILAVSYYLGHKRIFEAPIELNFDLQASVLSKNILLELVRTFIDTLAIFYRLKILRYYDSANKKNWRFDPDLRVN